MIPDATTAHEVDPVNPFRAVLIHALAILCIVFLALQPPPVYVGDPRPFMLDSTWTLKLDAVQLSVKPVFESARLINTLPC